MEITFYDESCVRRLERKAVAEDWGVVEFARARLGFEADPLQARVLESDAKRGILNCTRQWGKSTVAAIKAVHRGYTVPESLVVVTSPSERQSAEFVRKAALFLGRLGIQARGDGQNAASLLFPNGSRIVGLPGTETTIRGFSAVSLLVIDEAARVPDDLYKALRPMLAVANGDLWLASTPYGRDGFFYEHWVGSDAEWERIAVKATDCPRISPGFLEEERECMGEVWFAQEYLCEFVENGRNLFEREVIEDAMDAYVEVMRLDVKAPLRGFEPRRGHLGWW